jgi:hypothetical protein
MGSTHQVANASNAMLETNQVPTARRVRAVPLLTTRFGKALMVGLAHGVKQERSPMRHAQVAMHALGNTRTMVDNAPLVKQEPNRTQRPLRPIAIVALNEATRSSRL